MMTSERETTALDALSMRDHQGNNAHRPLTDVPDATSQFGPTVPVTVAKDAPSDDQQQESTTTNDMSQAGISADEIALYDRQIRLWGVKAQEQIRSANILLVTVKGVGTEVAKNLILAGINSLTINDSGTVTDDDLGAQYFLRDEHVGSNRARAAAPRLQELNPRVRVVPDDSDIGSKSADFFAGFDLVVATDMPFFSMSMLNAGARMAGRPFYAAGIHGFYGFVLADLVQHDFVIERDKSNVATAVKSETSTRSTISVSSRKENGKTIEMVTKRETYSPLLLANSSPLPEDYLRNRRKLKNVTPLLPAFRALWDFERSFGRLPGHSREDLVAFTQSANEKLQELQLPLDTLKSDFLRSFLQNVGSEISPVAAFVGGRLTEDIVNVLGKREQPIQNTLLFDGDTCQAPIYALHPMIEAPLANGNAVGTTFANPTPSVNIGSVHGTNGVTLGTNGNGSTLIQQPPFVSMAAQGTNDADAGALA